MICLDASGKLPSLALDWDQHADRSHSRSEDSGGSSGSLLRLVGSLDDAVEGACEAGDRVLAAWCDRGAVAWPVLGVG